MKYLTALLTVLTLIACHSGAPAPAATSGAAPPSDWFDHHIHILSPGLVRDWKSLGVPFSRADEAYTTFASIRDTLGASGGGILVPMAHYYGNEEFRTALGTSVDDEHARVRVENDHVAAEAHAAGGDVTAFCSGQIGARPLVPRSEAVQLDRPLFRHGDFIGSQDSKW